MCSARADGRGGGLVAHDDAAATTETTDPATNGDERGTVVPNGSEAATEATRDDASGPPTTTVTYSVGGSEVPVEWGSLLWELQEALDMPVWCLMTNDTMNRSTFHHFLEQRDELIAGEPVAVVVESYGGLGSSAYQISRMFQRSCGGFVAVVPSFAKSAATLFVLGAGQLLMGRDAELGPIDAQVKDNEREESGSALNEVQALDRLHKAALEEFDVTMQLLLNRTGKKVETLLPYVLKFITDMTAPLLEKIDTVHYTQQSRTLKVAEDYAIRLLAPNYGAQSVDIAQTLVNDYSEHGFVIDRDEAGIFLHVAGVDHPAQPAVEKLERLFAFPLPMSMIGKLTMTEVEQ